MAPDPREAPDVEALADQPRVSLSYDDIRQETQIGTGGNADVYRATVVGSGETVALKVPRIEGTLSARAVEQFVEEAETWAKLDDHPHVVSLLDWDDEPLPWIAMEYMGAGNLGERVGGVDLREGVWICSRVARALRHAHRRGVAHLDLKPANVLFRSTDPGYWDVPKVSDWGLAKLLLEHSQSVEGLSPQYAAPEQFDAEAFGPPDNATDVFQLGVVTYELLTGRKPFEGGHAAVMHAILEEDPAPPSAVADVPPAVDDAVMPALAKDKADRYEDVLLFRDALDDLLATLERPASPAREVRESGRHADADDAGPGTSARAEVDLSASQPDEDARAEGSTRPDDGAQARTGTTAPGTTSSSADPAEGPLDEQLAAEETPTVGVASSETAEGEATTGTRRGEGRSQRPARAETHPAGSGFTPTVLDEAVLRRAVGSRVVATLLAAAVYLVARGDQAVFGGWPVVLPSLAIPPVAGLLFGLPGVVGMALGGFLSDVVWYGGVGPVSAFAAAGDAAFALIPWLLLRRTDVLLDRDVPDFRGNTGRQLVAYAVAVGVAATVNAAIIGGGIMYTVSIPFQVVVDILIRNVVAVALFGVVLLYVLAPRVAWARSATGE